eukprot:TRINITY_DN505_c0_g1_i3.p1 TRINITY_DN505_c0_g1~~TRINITY_DN505_c0_g1_i3.p1  ORF type:complete len:299 (-),score=19.41 TRINITY_DN505_c0_g1_i3:301-1197(-)
MSLPPSKWQYFKYDVVLPTNGKLLHIYAEPGPDKLLVCASAKTPYPTQEGFADKEEVEQEFNGIKAVPLDPFVINSKGQVGYRPTTKDTEKSESVGIIIDKDTWKHFGGTCHVSVKNLTNADLSFSIKAHGTFALWQPLELAEADALDSVTKHKYAVYSKIVNKVHANSISNSERKAKNILGVEFTYGEILFSHFLPVLFNACDGVKGVFWDLGCGAGKVLIAAAMSGCFSEVYGVEYVPGLARAASNAVEEYARVSKTEGLPTCTFSFDKLKPVHIAQENKKTLTLHQIWKQQKEIQ